jgi:hypothetical protein
MTVGHPELIRYLHFLPFVNNAFYMSPDKKKYDWLGDLGYYGHHRHGQFL